MKYEMMGFLDKIFTIQIDRVDQSVTASIASQRFSKMVGIPVATARYMGDQFGCQLLSVNREERNDSSPTVLTPFDYSDAASVSVGDPQVELSHCVQDIVDVEFTEEALERNHTRGIVVMHGGRIVGEGYQTNAGIVQSTRVLGWSMTKSLLSALVGVAVGKEIITLDTPLKLSQVSTEHKQRIEGLNGGKPLTFRDLLQMNDVLQVEENYGFTKDIVEMIYTADSSAAFASSRQDRPLKAPHDMLYFDPGSGKHSNRRQDRASFEWYYSSAVSNLLAHELRTAIGNDAEYHAFPHKYLFSRIGAPSFAIETDPSGGFTGSSFGFATVRDWAKLGELFLRNGSWNGEQIIPSDYVQFVQQPHPLSGGHYGGHFWLNPTRVSVAEYNLLSADLSPAGAEKQHRAWMTTSVPADAYFMCGFQGQYVMIVPSKDLVVARLGRTNDRTTWDAGRFFGSVVNCIQ